MAEGGREGRRLGEGKREEEERAPAPPCRQSSSSLTRRPEAGGGRGSGPPVLRGRGGAPVLETFTAPKSGARIPPG